MLHAQPVLNSGRRADTVATQSTQRPTELATIYKICERTAWRQADDAGRFLGAAADLSDGYIHFSTAAQAAETAARHFADTPDLVVIAVDADRLGADLKWEPSRGGALFPHLYAALEMSAVKWVRPLSRGKDGVHVFPELEP